MEISKMLTLSTAHVTMDTIILLERAFSCKEWSAAFPLVVVGKYAVEVGQCYGYMIAVPEDIDELTADIVPEDLIRCLLFAQANGCEWLCLDGDGEAIEGLETFEW